MKVGDLLRVDKDTEFPADLLLVSCPPGKEMVYVDTMNLDGETNLKEKHVFEKDMVELNMLEGNVVCDLPNESLDDWDANVSYG